MYLANKMSKIKSWFLEQYIKLREEYNIARTKIKDLAQTNYNLGIFHLYKGNNSDAKMRFNMVLKMRPNDSMSLFNLARCYVIDENNTKAATYAKRALEVAPDLLEAHYIMAVIENNRNFKELPTSIIKEYFTYNAEEYNAQANENNYCAPLISYNLVIEHINKDSKILDIGCGTGLLAKNMIENKICKYLEGVDFSKQMLEQAKQIVNNDDISIYDKVINNDINNYLTSNIDNKFDIIFAITILNFVNNIDDILKKCRNIIHDNGYIVIAINKAINSDMELNSDFTSYCYSEDYIKNALKQARFNISTLVHEPMDDNISGIFVVAKPNLD